MRNYFENDYTSYRFQEGILHIVYHQGASIDLNAAVQIVKDKLLLHEGRLLPVLCDIRGVNEINKSARAYLAMEGSTLTKAVAVIVESPVSKMLSEFYIRTSNPPIPTQSFQRIEDALSFLNKFMTHSH
ncbi:STAS/SEC14 domain-containing protein [Mariniflexile litorale]|uniref:STAS/SEC14 domain-containing protein n=1 Tax=Mariniflexile litorale TaxID=3045158 RepID=A0AAU7EDE6_9FLAO|nr:STAS/SEC14 domain-containing protein [Mariniflexile sp. KMM 9835]MDQ8213480.1 STAS/SEC14 domain-containing protein [Mariniflexile sp. KMM 9835]